MVNEVMRLLGGRSVDQLTGQDLGLGGWLQPALFAVPCFSRFQHCMTDPAFLVASLSPALITCTQPPEVSQESRSTVIGGVEHSRVATA